MIKNSFISRVGGKRKHLNLLIPMFIGSELYIEPFLGSGIVYFNTHRYSKYILNDIDPIIYKSFKCLKEMNYSEIEKLDFSGNKEKFYRLKEIYFEKKFKDDFEETYIWNYLTKHSFRNVMSIYYNEDRKLNNMIPLLKLCKEKMENDNVEIFNQSYFDISEKYNFEDSFWFLDPPYIERSCSHYSEGKNFDMNKFIETLYNMKGKFLLTISDLEVEKYFDLSKFNHKKIKSKYDLSFDKMDKYEYIITNYEFNNNTLEDIL